MDRIITILADLGMRNFTPVKVANSLADSLADSPLYADWESYESVRSKMVIGAVCTDSIVNLYPFVERALVTLSKLDELPYLRLQEFVEIARTLTYLRMPPNSNEFLRRAMNLTLATDKCIKHAMRSCSLISEMPETSETFPAPFKVPVDTDAFWKFVNVDKFQLKELNAIVAGGSVIKYLVSKTEHVSSAMPYNENGAAFHFMKMCARAKEECECVVIPMEEQLSVNPDDVTVTANRPDVDIYSNSYMIGAYMYDNGWGWGSNYTGRTYGTFVSKYLREGKSDVDIIRTDIDPVEFITREFDLDIAKCWFDGEHIWCASEEIYTAICERRFTLDFHKSMTMNYTKAISTVKRIVKYVGRGFTYVPSKFDDTLWERVKFIVATSLIKFNRLSNTAVVEAYVIEHLVATLKKPIDDGVFPLMTAEPFALLVPPDIPNETIMYDRLVMHGYIDDVERRNHFGILTNYKYPTRECPSGDVCEPEISEKIIRKISECIGSGTQAFGSGTQAFGSGTQAFGSGTQAFGSGTQAISNITYDMVKNWTRIHVLGIWCRAVKRRNSAIVTLGYQNHIHNARALIRHDTTLTHLITMNQCNDKPVGVHKYDYMCKCRPYDHYLTDDLPRTTVVPPTNDWGNRAMLNQTPFTRGFICDATHCLGFVETFLFGYHYNKMPAEMTHEQKEFFNMNFRINPCIWNMYMNIDMLTRLCTPSPMTVSQRMNILATFVEVFCTRDVCTLSESESKLKKLNKLLNEAC
jgi:hypothetical protein